MNDRWIWLGDGTAPPGLGGKGENLARLAALGHPVPPFFTIGSTAFEEMLAAAGLEPWVAGLGDRIFADGELARESAALVARIRETPIPTRVADAIRDAFRRRLPGGALVAVRSSAADEDSAGGSFAGLHDSFLFVRGEDDVIDAVRRVWASAFGERALAYRVSRRLPLGGIRMAIVVQEMIDATSSGVVFTANPNDGDPHEIVVSALFGAGEGLVSVGLPADTFVVSKGSFEIASTIADKDERIVFDSAAGRGVLREAVPTELRTRPSLSGEQLRELANRGVAVERAYGRPQDLEFAFNATGSLFLLQTRPITTVNGYGPAAGNGLLWDNSNIVESFSGVTSPMTFSFIRRAYAVVYDCFAEVMGVPAETIRESRPVFENMLGLIRGRVYYNLRSWYRLVRLFPGFEANRGFMESMMGVRELDGRSGHPAPGFLRPPVVRRGSGAGPTLRPVDRQLPPDPKAGRRVRDGISRPLPHLERPRLPRPFRRTELAAVWRDMERDVLARWKAPIINDFFVMIFYGLLKKLACFLVRRRQRLSAERPDLRRRRDREHRAGEAAARAGRVRPPGSRASRGGWPRFPSKNAGRASPPNRGSPHFRRRSSAISMLYGFRCMNELKLEEPSLRDRPGVLFRMMDNYVSAADPSVLDLAAIEKREQRIRRAAELKAFAAFSGSPLRRLVFRFVLDRARLGVRNRENLRFARTRIFGLVRELMRAMGDRLVAEGVLETTGDVFYLTIDEVWDYVKGTAVTVDLRGLAALRKREFDEWRSLDPPDDRFETFGMVYNRNRFRRRGGRTPFGATDGGLRGIGCSPGEVTGMVKIVRSSADDIDPFGRDLVAERTDPGWVPLYPSISGLLVERGCILSHSAIVAREMGIPTIVGIPGLLAALSPGNRVVMDGSAGNGADSRGLTPGSGAGRPGFAGSDLRGGIPAVDGLPTRSRRPISGIPSRGPAGGPRARRRPRPRRRPGRTTRRPGRSPTREPSKGVEVVRWLRRRRSRPAPPPSGRATALRGG